jgi:hypothetical protein
MGDTNELSPGQTPTDSPAAEAPLEPASLTQDQPADAPAPVEGGDAGAEEPKPPAWATVSDASELFELEDVKPLHEERLNAARETAKKEGASETHRRLQPLIDRQLDTVRGINDKVEQFTSQWNRLARAKDADGNLAVDPARLQDLLDDNREAFAALSGMHRSEGVWSGAAGLAKELGDAMKSDTFASDFRPRLERLQRGDTDSAIFTDMVEAIADSAKKPLQAELKEAKAEIANLKDAARAAARNGQPAPANPPGGAGAGASMTRTEEDAILLNPESDMNLVREIRARR